MTAYWVEFVYNMDQQNFAPGDPFPATNQLASFLGNPVYGPSVNPVPYSSYPFGYVAQAYSFAIQGDWQLVQQPNGLNWQYQETNVVEWTYTIGIGNYFVVGSQPDPTTLVGPTATASAWNGPPYPNTSPGTVSVQWTTYAWEEINVSPPSGPIVNISNAPAVQKSPSQSQVETFTVSLSSPSADTITVDYATHNGTAVAGTDFQATHGTLTFAPGQTSQTIQVPLLGTELSNPPSEKFSVALSNLTDSGSAGAVVGVNTGFGEIDGALNVSIADTTPVKEGNDGTLTPINFTLSLSQPAPTDVTVEVDFQADPSVKYVNAVAGVDWITGAGLDPLKSLVTFHQGQTQATLTVQAVGDNFIEPDEFLTAKIVSVSDPTIGISLTNNTAKATILNDDGALQNNVIINGLSVLDPQLANLFSNDIDAAVARIEQALGNRVPPLEINVNLGSTPGVFAQTEPVYTQSVVGAGGTKITLPNALYEML